MEEQYSFPAESSIKFDIPIQMLPAGMGRPSADLFRQGSDLVGNSRGIGVPTTPVSAVDATTCLSALRAPVRSVRMDDGASGCVRTEAGRVALFQMTGASIINVRIWEES
jgi:hypothetical protein